jgi:hypothetical protein
MTLRTDLDIVQLPPTPSFGGFKGAGIINTDPDFMTKIARITDGLTYGGLSLYTGDTPNRCLWNTDDTMLIVKHAGNASLLFQFDPATMAALLLPYKYPGRVSFSSQSPTSLFVLLGTQIWQVEFNLLNGQYKYQGESRLCDFADILPAGFDPEWVGNFSHSADDSTFCVSFSEGTQDTGFLCCVFRQRVGLKMLNTTTGEITGWGIDGKSKSQPWSAKTLIHDSLMTPNPQYVAVAIAGVPSPSIWNLSTLDVPAGIVDGHTAKGYQHYYAGGVGGGQFAEVPYANPKTKRLIVPEADLPANQTPPQKYKAGQHAEFGVVSLFDSSIFWTSTYDFPDPFTSCWQGEIDGYVAAGSQSGQVFRACHHFSSGKSTEFSVQYAIANPSQTGNFVAFCSDMMGTLGSNTGGKTGILGKDARGDVFVVNVGG